MGKKGRKTRWRKLPIPIGNGGQQQQHRQANDDEDDDPSSAGSVPQPASRTTFNEDEYTKITTPRQDMLFKKGYLGRKKTTPTPSQDTTDAQSADSVESEQYCCEEPMPQYLFPAPTGYIDHTGIYYLPNYEVYDPYTGGVTVVVGPGPAGFPGPPQVLAALPCGPVPLQQVEWYAPMPQPVPPPPHYNPPRKKSTNSIDSQNWSGQSSESTCPPGSPQDSTEQCELQPYVYPGYMFGQPVYNMNGVNVQGVLPAAPQTPTDQSKRRKKRRRRRRGGVTDEGSESSCEEVCSIEAPGSSASSSKTNSDSGIATDPCGASGGQGSLSSLSNDEAEKDIKSLQSEGDTPSTDVKEEELKIELSPQTSSIEEKESSTLSNCNPPNSECLNSSEHIVEVDCVAQNTPALEVESAETPEEIPDSPQRTLDESEVTEISQKEDEDEEDEIMVETNEAFSDAEFGERDNTCSSDESTLPCTADDRSIEEPELDTVERLSSDVQTLLQLDTIPAPSDQDKVITGFNDVSMYDLDHLELEPEPPPIAPPRRKKCAKTAEKLASKLSEEIVTDAVSSAAEQKWPITSAVTKWLEDSEDEIEEAEEVTTGQKNGEGNPFPAPFHSGSGTRVASAEWYNSRVREMCDPIASVNKYYRLALPMKTGPFPCGVCCIIQ